VGGLDVAHQANLALEHWQACIELLGEMEQVERALGLSDHEIARARFNQYKPLIKLGQLDQAKVLLAGCLDVFREVGDIPNEAMTLSALADVWNELGDGGQALAFQRQALAALERSPDPEGRSISHGNLDLYLGTTGTTDDAREHALAALVYFLITGLNLRVRLMSLAIDIRNAARRGEHYDLPRLTDLLENPAFSALRSFIAERGVPVEALQAKVEQLVEQTRAHESSS
jgi:tetratricopeptide (TPR) repeat protein